MTEMLNARRHFRLRREDLGSSTEAQLLALARDGDSDAFGELWVRHEPVALGVARRISPTDPDDLVAEAFARVLRALRAGKGPTDDFRAYLCQTVRACSVDHFRRSRIQTVTIDDVDLPGVGPEPDPGDEPEAARRAWEQLSKPQRWLLWASAVEGYTVAEMAEKLDARPGTVAVWLFRARERLSAAFLEGHVQPSADATCQTHRARFVPYLRGTLGTKRRLATEAHLDACPDCAAALAAAYAVNHKLRVVIWPVLPAAAVLGLDLAHAPHLGTWLSWQHTLGPLATAKGAVAGAAAATVAAAAVTTAIVVTNPGTPPVAAQVRPPSHGVPSASYSTARDQARPAPATLTPSASAATTAASPGATTPDASNPAATDSATGAASVTTEDPLRETTPPSGDRLRSPDPAPCTGQLLVNPGFEDGSTGWTTSNAGVFSDGGYSRTGEGYAWLGSQAVPVTETVTQTVAVPAGCQATFTYWMRVSTNHTESTATETLRLTADGDTLQTFSNLSVSSWAIRTADLSAYAGQSVTLTWTYVQPTNTTTAFWIDDTALTIS